jgi:hypothetical protein
MAQANFTPAAEAIPPRPGYRWRYLLTAAGALAAVAWIAIAILASHAAPYLKDHLVLELEQRFHGKVELGRLQVSAFPELHVTGENLVMRREDSADRPPFLQVRRFEFRASPLGLLRWPVSAGTVHLAGLEITFPPRGQRPRLQESGESRKAPSKTFFVIGKIVCDDTRLEIMTDKPGKVPLIFEIHSVVMNSAGPGRAMPFTATLTNAKPIGDIGTKGEFGPWETQEPRDTPVSGTFSFIHADLGTIKGIGGILSSKGSYNGILDRIEVQGETDTPDFTVSTGGHPVPLHTEYNATVDGTTGDTYLHPVRARLLSSLIIANGSVVREAGGHQVNLDVVSTGARVEDLLKVAVKSSPPALSGPVNLSTKFVLPHGPEPVPERLMLDGSFDLPAAHLSSASAQEKLDQLSLRAQGKAKEAQTEAKNDDLSDVLSELRGKFTLNAGVLSLSDLNFKVPGASIRLAGDYHLQDEDFSFEGHARLEAKLSQTTTGVKSFFLKALDPFFANKGAGTLLPIRIHGTGTTPGVGFDFGHAKRAE